MAATLMIWCWVQASQLAGSVKNRLAVEETGSLTVEQALITGGLVVLAGGVMAAIGVVVAKYVGQIK